MTFRIEKDRFDSYLIIEFDSGRTFAIELFNLVLAPVFGLMAVTFFAMLAAVFMAIPTPLNWLLLGAFVIATGACIVAMSKR